MLEEVLPMNSGPDLVLVIHRKETWAWHMFQRRHLSHPICSSRIWPCYFLIKWQNNSFPPGSGQARATFTDRVHGSYTVGLLRLSHRCDGASISYWSTSAGSPEPPHKKSNQVAIAWEAKSHGKTMYKGSSQQFQPSIHPSPDARHVCKWAFRWFQPPAVESFQGMHQACAPETTCSTVFCLSSWPTDFMHIIKWLFQVSGFSSNTATDQRNAGTPGEEKLSQSQIRGCWFQV